MTLRAVREPLRANGAVTHCGEPCGQLGTTTGFLRVPNRDSHDLSVPGAILWMSGGQ